MEYNIKTSTTTVFKNSIQTKPKIVTCYRNFLKNLKKWHPREEEFMSGILRGSGNVNLKHTGSRLVGRHEEEPESDQHSFDFKEFLKMLIPEIWYLLAAVVCAIGAAVLNVEIPLLLGDVVNVISKFTKETAENFVNEIKKPAIKLVTYYSLQAFLTFCYISLLSTVGENIAVRLRTRLFEAILKQDIQFFDKHKTGELVDRLTSDVQDFKSSFKLCISQGLRACTQTVGSVGSLYVISPKLTGLMVTVVPVIIGVGTLLGSGLRSMSKAANEQVSKSTAVADEAIGNVRTVRAFAMETKENQSLAQMSLLFGNVIRGLAAGARVFEMEHVQFSYPTRPEQVVLKDFTLHIPGGNVVALCGLSGGGKSTVAALLERFYDIDHGKITIDGYDLKQLDPTWLRGHAIGFINQEPVLFATSVMENIRYGRPDATDQEVLEAAALANAHEFITKFPNGYNTVLGERGVTVSGGQKQRIAIARALIKNPSILILDEATSALDAESERLVQEALDRVIKDWKSQFIKKEERTLLGINKTTRIRT
ncbi:hypothetical protein KUTeg_023488 [Tegillarca granosa]|uniref:Mitochondrial potassium channel ATP-binding subunit n=1 Tax=Tegillarca granosa TaxID=220873 RepID=A0ABQ9E7Z0_TEGGR|nr:hypothetical protein KUTeg_023488 [Tegillarca granosa]